MTRLRMLALLLAGLPLFGVDAQLRLTSAHITAGDLAAILPEWRDVPATTALAPAPLPGVNRRVTRSQLLSWAHSHGVDTDASTLPERVLVARATRRLSEAEALGHIRDAISDKYGRPRESVRFRIDGFIEPVVPAGDLTFEVAGALTLNEPRAMRLRWTEPGGRTGGANIRGRVEIMGEFLRASRDVPAGVALAADDFDVISGPLPSTTKAYVGSTSEIVGMAAVRPLREGDAVSPADLRPQVLVHRGDLIELQLTAGAVRLRAPARAEQNGAAGEAIRCKNLQSNRTIEAIVRSSRLAEVYQ